MNLKCVLHRAMVSCAFDVSRCDGAMLEPGPLVLGCDRQVDLAAKEKVSTQRRSGVASSECTGQATRGCGQGTRGKCRRVVCNNGQVAESGLQAQRQCHIIDIA